jgi:hypothetical protein
MLANMVWSRSVVVQSDDATEPCVHRDVVAEVCQRLVVGRGHVSLLTNSDTWHSKLVRDIGYL